MEKIKRIGVTEILGREIVFYGSWECPYFIVRSVAEWIGYNISNANKLIKNIDENEKCTRTYITSEGNSTKAWFVTENGLYEILMRSTKPIAKQLKDKIKQYLKQIRKTGGAIEEGREEEFVNKYFPSFSEEVKLAMIQDLLKTNKGLKPKAEYHDKVLNNSKLKTTTDIAKDLGMTAQKLNKLLHEKEVIYPKMEYKYKWRYRDYERPKGCCYDCRTPYKNFQDLIIPDFLWEKINPTYHEGGGLLCPSCIVNRLHYIGEWYGLLDTIIDSYNRYSKVRK